MLTQERVKELLHYDKTTGLFTWRVDRNGFVKEGYVAGSLKKDTGYVVIRIDNREYQAHRLSFLYMEGYHPEYQVDHLNGVRNDNRWVNLRHVTRVCNLQNRCISSMNTSGFPGVYYDNENRKWKSQICINKVVLNLGRYTDKLEAALARYTVESQCKEWTCDNRSELALAILKEWPEFKNNR